MENTLSDFDKAENLQNLVIAVATDADLDNDGSYQGLSQYFLSNNSLKHLIPKWIKTNRDLGQLWHFIKKSSEKYEGRREFIWTEFAPLLEYLETKGRLPSDITISEGLKNFDEENIKRVWEKAIDRRQANPEGAITAAKTLLETVCKHILEEAGKEYKKDADLPLLYRLVSDELNLSPSQQTEDAFKQILGGTISVVNGLGTLRNRLGDAHGQGKLPVRPATRHAELVVNLAGSVSLFLVATWENRKQEWI